MELNTINTVTRFCGVDKTSQEHTSVPRTRTQPSKDVFVSEKGTAAAGVLGKFFNKVKETITSPETAQKINEARLTKLFIQNGSFDVTDFKELQNNKEIIKELAKSDYNNVEKKYNSLIKNIRKEEKNPKSFRYKNKISLGNLAYPLKYEKLQAQDIDEIYRIKRSRPADENPCIHNDLDFNQFLRTLNEYDNFDNLPASTQKSLMNSLNRDYPTFNTITTEEAGDISDSSPLMKFGYIKDLKSVKSNEELVKILDARRRNIPCKAIPSDNEAIERVLSKEGIDNLSNALKETDLTKYEKGFPLKYSRNDFIKDFNNLVADLNEDDRAKVFDHFQFKINTANDIINYPNPAADEVPDGLEEVTAKAQKLINKFMLENEVQLAPEDNALENELNNIIKAYPEFVSIMGKIQHRGDSIDHHTLDDLKRIMADERFERLPDSEQKILTTATLFHDFGKAQKTVDKGHEKKSALEAKEIIKKTPLSLDEKERIFNLINHSHWYVDGSKEDDIAFCFRRPNDFMMAEMFEKADSNSAGFDYSPSKTKTDNIKQHINKINSTGIPLFADNLPAEDKYYDKTQAGIRYLDLRDPEMSVEKYGYPKGTKVKDLKFLCHSSYDEQADFEALCDDSKEVCLSTSLLDCRNKFSTGYNSGDSYILSGNNANIVLGGKDVGGTGGHRGYHYAKETMYLHDTQGLSKNYAEIERQMIPDQIKEKLNLSNEEYTEIYTNICNLKNKNDIEDIELSNGRKIRAKDIKQTISDIQKELVRPREKGEKGYTNEIVVYNPKIEAKVLRQITPENLEKGSYTDEIFVLV